MECGDQGQAYRMRYFPLVACLILAIAGGVAASPWGRIKSTLTGRNARDEAPSQWVDERELGPYLIRSEFPLRDVLELVQDLGDLQQDIEEVLQLKCEPASIQIHLFNNKRNYNDYVRVRVPEGVNRQALYVPGKGSESPSIYAYRQRDLETDVRHETTHALLHTALPYVPIWIDEGLAEYFEIPAARRVKGHPHGKELRDAIRYQRWQPNMKGLEAKKKLMDMDGKDYRDAWGIVHFMLHGPPEARQALDHYFEEIQSWEAPTPLSQHLKKLIPDLDQAIIAHLK